MHYCILKPQEYLTVAEYFYVYCRVGLHVPTKFFGVDHDGMSFEAVFGFNVNNHGNCLRPLFLHWIVAFGVTRGCLLVGGIPRFHRSLELVHQTWTLFSASSFDCNFRPNNNQTFIVYVKSTLVLYRKALCGFSWFWDSPWKKSYVEQSVASFTDQREYKSVTRHCFFRNILYS